MTADSSPDIPSILARIAGGEAAAFGEIVTRYQRPLFGFLGRMGLAQAQAEDIAQDTFLGAWRNHPRATPEAMVVTAVILRSYIRTTTGRLWWDSSRLRIPLLGDALRKAETARFARSMATLVANSVPLVQSIGIAAAILTNRKMAGALGEVAQGVKRGEGIAAPIRKAAVFPPLAAHLLMVGEETGRLDQMFARMAEIYETDTRTAVKRFTSLFEPLVILVMGVMVGALILSMLLAITSINDVAV